MTEHQDKDMRREQILDAAATMFITRGYENGTVDDIAKLAGLSKGSIYWYFKSKLEILFELTDRCVHESQQLIVRLAEQDKYGPEALYKAHRDLFAMDLQYPDRHQILHQLSALAAQHPEIRERLKDYHRKWDETTVALLNRAVEQGHFRPHDTRHLAQAISALHYGLHMRSQMDPSIDEVAVIESTMKLVYDSLTAHMKEKTDFQDKE